jgi:phthiocerol/phenolphthiocerol synthesis type-I polyketide synthase E
MEALGRVWASGVDLDFGALNPSSGARSVPLPTYPFERQEYWIAPPARRQDAGHAGASTPATHAAPHLRQGFGGQAGHESPASVPVAISTRHKRPALTVAYAPPVDDVERELTDIWEELIGVAGLGIHDDFFELGGDSLVAVRLIARIRERLGIELDVRALFDCTTIARLSARVREELEGSAPDREMSQLLELVGLMSEEQAEGLLATWQERTA